ncbi:MAG TPA: MEDS domain-containing protein, partial [Kofleriaceae bacterium]|nr:MEDS domain-containing protein [Kofleriaceae bacterium]
MPATRAGWAQALSEPGRHIAQLYRSPAFLADAVGLYLAEGVRRGESCLVIAVPENRDAILAAMARHGAEPSQLIAAGRLALHDAEQMLSDLIDGGRIDRTRAEQVFAASLDELCGEAPLRAYGEMVMLLWRSGNAAIAVDLERVWNKLLTGRPVSLLCGYQLDHVGATFPSFSEACHEHVVVLPSEQYLELA